MKIKTFSRIWIIPEKKSVFHFQVKDYNEGEKNNKSFKYKKQQT